MCADRKPDKKATKMYPEECWCAKNYGEVLVVVASVVVHESTNIGPYGPDMKWIP